MLQHCQLRNGCCCKCHDDLTHCTFSQLNNPTDFDPNHPVPVNQTALNAARGRNGLPAGDASATKPKSKDEEADDALKDLDRLERLLILEHKERVKESLDADRLGMLRATGKDLRPEPLPPGYVAGRNSLKNMSDLSGAPGAAARNGSNYVGFSDDVGFGENMDPETIREAYILAHRCPVTPPPQCRASHRLQDVVDDVRMVALDPCNPHNRRSLRRVLNSNGIGEPLADEDAQRQVSGGVLNGGSRNSQGNKDTLASLRATSDHPQGTGVVWYKGLKFGDVIGSKDLTPGAAAAVSVRKEEGLDAVAVKRVTYAD